MSCRDREQVNPVARPRGEVGLPWAQQPALWAQQLVVAGTTGELTRRASVYTNSAAATCPSLYNLPRGGEGVSESGGAFCVVAC